MKTHSRLALSSRHCGVLAALHIALLLAAGCSSEDGAGAGKADSGATTKPKTTVKHAGPCTTTYITSKGQEHAKYIARIYDNDGRLTQEKTADFAEKLDALRWTHTWTYGQTGNVLHEKFETSDTDAPNFEWAYGYDAKGNRTTQKGAVSGWDRASCTLEYYAKEGKLSGRLCDWERDQYDDEGVLTGTQKGKHIISYSYGPTQLAEEWLEDGASSPDKVVTKALDDKGRIIKIETDWSLRGYAEHSIVHTYDEAGNLVKTTTDTNGDGTVNQIVTRTWDSVANELTVAFDPDADGKPSYSWKHNYDCWQQQ